MNATHRGFFLLAGSQCAGKTTAKNYLYARYMVRDHGSSAPRNLVLLQEMRQLVMHERGIHSAIFIDSETEQEIIRRDLERLEGILSNGGDRVYIDETGVFTLAHARRHGLSTTDSLDRYRKLLQSLDAAVIFLNTPPSSSWTRRKPKYEERVAEFPRDQIAVVLAQYRKYLDSVHEGLLDLVKQLDFPFREIDASRATEDTLRACAEAFVEVAVERGVQLVPRF